MRHVLCAVLAAVALSGALAAAPPKIHPEVLQRARAGARVPVFVLLAHQPQPQIMERLHGAAWLRTEIEEAEYQRLARQPFVPHELLSRAHARLDAVTLETRQIAAREIDAAILTTQQAVSSRLIGLGSTEIRRFRIVNMLVAEIAPDAVAAMESDPEIAEVFPVENFRALLNVSTATLGAPAYWSRGFTGAGQSVAVMDSGMKTDHPAFSKLISRVFLDAGKQNTCFNDKADSVEDANGHGTHVGGIVASQGPPDFSAAMGVARSLGTLYNLKVAFQEKAISGQCNEGLTGNTVDAWDGIEWAVLNTPVRIFNYSFGGPAPSDDSPQSRLFDYLIDTYKITLVVSAGNEGPGPRTVATPGNAYNVISVANLDDVDTPNRADDRIHSSSSRGPTEGGRFKPDVAAPGSNITSLDSRSNGFVTLTGTSMAAPHVAGAAALLLHAGVSNPLAIKALLINTTDAQGWNSDSGWGSVNLSNTAGKSHYIESQIAPAGQAGSVLFYRGAAPGALKATLVWNRHVTVRGSSLNGSLNDLNLQLYNRLNNTLVSRSESAIQNVEQVFGRVTGDVVLKVKSNSPAATATKEAFVLALPESGFTAATGPAVALSCAAPPGVGTGSRFTVECTASNTGQLEAFGAIADATLPSGFSGTPQQSFGTIPPAGRVLRSFALTAPAAEGRSRIPIALAGASFGEAFSTSATVDVAVGASTTTLAVSTNTLQFRFRTGGTAPAAQTFNVTTGAASPFTVAVSSGSEWLSVTPASATAPASVRASVNPAGLTPGSYQASITIRATGVNNSPQILGVTLVVEGVTGAVLARGLTARTLPSGEGCPVPDPASAFNGGDAHVYVWFQVNSARAGDKPTVNWVQPNGVLYQTVTWNPVPSDGSWCFWASIDVAGKAPASIEGKWTANVLWNSIAFSSFDFTITNVVTLVEVRTSATAEICTASEPLTVFQISDPQATVFFRVRNAKKGDLASVEWESPDGSVYRTTRWAAIPNDGAYCFADKVEIAEKRAALLPGDWIVRGQWNGTLVFTHTFRIVPPVIVERRLTSNALPEERGCLAPPVTTIFSPKDARAVAWFSVREAKTGDRPGMEWYAPDGSLYKSFAWDPLDSEGNWCFSNAIDIADNAPASLFGQWNVKVSWNDKPAFTLPFSLAPVRIERRALAKAIPSGTGCPTPESTDTFLTTDERVFVWWLALDGKTGDVAKAEWYDPNGRLYVTNRWPPLVRDGNFCFNGSMTIAGQSAAQRLGTWTVTVSWNDVPLFAAPFTLAQPPE
ncbi:MAG: S8 family serine peptidase [Bryobacteraceae bacterium]